MQILILTDVWTKNGTIDETTSKSIKIMSSSSDNGVRNRWSNCLIINRLADTISISNFL